MKSMAIFGSLQNFCGFHLIYCEIHGFQLNLQFKSSDALLDLPGKGETSGESFGVIIYICISFLGSSPGEDLIICDFISETINRLLVCIYILHSIRNSVSLIWISRYCINPQYILRNLQISIIFLWISSLYIVKSMDLLEFAFLYILILQYQGNF